MNFCPNTSSPEWKALVDAVGEFEAMRDFMENETIRSVNEVVKSKPQLLKTGDNLNSLYQLQPDENLEEYIVSEKTIRDLGAMMSDRIGIPVEFESSRDKNYKGKLENNIAKINLAYATLDTPIHEILGHPIVRAIKGSKQLKWSNIKIGENKDFPGYYVTYTNINTGKTENIFTFEDRASAIEYKQTLEKDNFDYNGNKQLYQNLLKELEYGRGKEVLDRVKKDYQYKEGRNPFKKVKSHDITEEFILSNRDSFKSLYIGNNQIYAQSDGKWYIFTNEKGQIKKDLSAKELSQFIYDNTTPFDTVDIFDDSIGKYTVEEQQEEAIVELLGLYTANRLNAVKDGKLISLLKRLLNEIKAFVRQLLSQKEVEVDKLPDNMTIGDIADLLAYSNSKLILPGYEVEYTTPDNMKFKTYTEASNHISKLAKSVSDIDLSSITVEKIKSSFPQDFYAFNGKEFTDINGKVIRKNENNNWQIEQDFGGDLGVRWITIDEQDAFDIYTRKYGIDDSINGFIEKNKPYEQSKEIIEEWKKVNNIKYNPEEVYSRGQEFISVLGAYSIFDVKLMMQNLLQHIEDNEKAGGEFTISAFTKPEDRTINHLEGGGGKIKFKIYPKSKDIKWAANADVYSGSVWDASEKISKDKKSELLGVSYTKYPDLSNLDKVQPNLASIIDELAHYHNELGISLTGNNFRLEYDEDIPYQTKKIIDSINATLDQKYGKLVKPEISSPKLEKITLFRVKGESEVFNTREEAEQLAAKLSQADYMSFYVVETISTQRVSRQAGIQPTQTNGTLKESIDSIKDRTIRNPNKEYLLTNKYGKWQVIKPGYTKTGNIDVYAEFDSIDDAKKLAQELNSKMVKRKEYTEQALINTRIAKLKEVAKKYPRSLIRSEVKPSFSFFGENKFELFDKEELPFQKVRYKDNTQVSFYRDQAQYSERYSVLDNPIELDEAEFQQTRGNEIAEKLANKLRASVGVNSQLITLAHAKEMMDNAGKAYNGEPGFFFNGQVYLVREKMTTEIVFHEFAHPILKAIAIDNPELFENLYLQLTSTPEGQAIIEEVKKFYPEYDEDSSDFKEEALVRALSRAADAKFKNQPQSSGFLALIKEFFYKIKQYFRKLFKGTKIKIENLSETTTLDQLADMLMSESFAISTEKVTNADVVAFARDTRQQMIDDLASMEQNELAKLSKNMFDVFNKQAKIISSKNYKEIGQTLSDTMQRSDIKEILGNLRMFQREGDVKFETAEDEIKYMNAHAEAFLNSMTRFNLASRRILEHFKEISKDLNNPTNISRAFYLNRVIRDWGLFLNDIKSELRNQEYSEYIGPGNPLLGLINEIEETLTRTKAYTDKIYTAGVKDTIVAQLAPMAQTIDNYYTNILKRYEEKNAPAEVIARVKREYEEIRLTPKKIDQLLKGELGDAGAINSFLEGYMNNQDPIIFGFAGYVKDRFTEMNAVIQKQFNNFINSVSDLVDAAGYTTAYSRMQMGKDLLFLDTVRNESEGKDARKLWKFLNPWIDYEKDIRDLENKVEEAKKTLNEQKTDQAEEDYNTAIKNLKDFKAQYMHQEYTEEFGKLRSFFQDEIGKKAEAARAEILNKIQGLNSTVSSVDDIVDNLESLEVYWREYRLLYSLYNADGSPKEEDSMAYKVAIRLREHRNMSNKFYKWTPRKGAFQSAYLNFKQSLIDNGIKPTGKTAKEFKEKLEEWVSKNTVVKLTDKFYEDRAEIFARMSELSSEPAQLKIIENYGKIANIISAYKDKNSEPVGSEMPAELLATIKKIEEEIEELKQEVKESTTGLTAAEYDMYRSYKESIAMGEEPSEDEIDEFRRIKGKMKKKGITEEDLSKNAELSALYDRLNALQKREVSHDFIELVNDFLTSDPESLQIMKKSLKISRFSPTDIKMLQDSAIAEKFFDVNPKFKEWFLANTIARKTKRKGTKYYPTRAWTYIKPQDSAYYEKIDIKDDQDRTIDTIPGSPSLQYFYREVKDEYVDDNGEVIQLRTKRLTMLDCLKQGLPIENATVDMRGNFLPKLTGGNKYRNEAYFLLEKNSPAKFRLLQELIKQHLMLQEEMPYDSRLDLEAPRYRKSGLEAITSRPIGDTFRQNPLAVWARKIKSFFVRSADDMEVGLNPEEQSVVIKSDLYDDSHGRVPITGMYDIEPDQVSMDVMTGMMRYMQSGVRQKTLLDMMPTARALQSIVQNPDNNPDLVKDGIKIFSKAKMAVASVLTPQSQKALSIRAQAINAFIEREFEGKTQAGITKNMVGVNKTVNALFGLSSKAFFAFNIPSALKNSFGARFQSIIEGAGGKYFNWADYMKGTVWGNKVTAEISMELYKFGPKSVDVQLFEMMDPSQGRLRSKISQGTGISRSVFTDTAELGFLTNVRKWTELNATAGTFGAMLKKTLIERTMPDGSVEKISYDNAWEVVDGQIKLKSGIDKKWDAGGSEYNSFIRRLHGVINNLNGAYASFDSPNANRYLLFRFMMYMKTYFTRMFMNRFQYRYEKGMILPRYDANLNDISMGYYVEFLTGIKNLLSRYKGNISLMTPNEITAMKKTVTEVGMLLLISELIVSFLFDFDPDDDDKYEKLRKKSGPFPGLFVADDEHPFKAPGWFSNHMLNLALQVRAENDSFIPYPRWGLQDYGNLLNMESVSLQATLDMYIKLFTGITDYADYKLTGDQTALYKREVGPYYWQQEGGLKFVNHLAKTLSLSGTTVEPVVAISGLQSRENR